MNIKNTILISTFFFGILIFSGGFFLVFAESTTASVTSFPTVPIDLKKQIEEKSQELKKIQDQKDAVQNNLDEINKSQNTLKNQIRKFDANISQLNLSTKINEINIEKINLELRSIAKTIPEIQKNIEIKREAIKQLLIETQKNDRETVLSMVLKNKTLSQNVAEIQQLTSLNINLLSGISDLNDLQNELENKTEEVKYKKNVKNVEYTNLVNQKSIIQEQKSAKEDLLNQTKNQESVYQQQMSTLEKQQATISNEIESIESILRKNIDINLLPVARPLFLWPVPDGRITQGYGSTAFALHAYKGKYHNGIDIGAPIGTEILAPEKGRIINVGDQDKYCPRGAYGRFVVVKHENGLTTLYGHMSKYIVRIGDEVERGQVIGYIGKTGYATGPHLHFTVFASQTLTPARPGFPEGSQPSNMCGPMPVGGDLNPLNYF